MPDFSKLYQKPPGTARRPPQLPGGDYPAIIKSYEMSESREKRTPCVRYFLTLLDWPSDAPTSWTEVDDDGKRWDYTQEDIDLPRRVQRFEFWFPVDENTGEPNDGSVFRFDEFLRTLDLDPGTAGSYEELFPAPVGHRVIVSMVQQLNQQSGRIFTQAQKLVGQP